MKKYSFKALIKLFITIITGLILFITGFTCYSAGKTAAYSDNHNYYQKTEELLDSIYTWNDSIFIDVIMETDVYYEYEVERDKIYPQK